LNECNEKEIDSLSKLASREWDTRDEVLKTASFDDDYDDDAFVSNKVRFDAGQISARSTIFGNELEESKLLSTSCNSLGSFGEAVSKLDENDFYDENRGDSNDWFKADQVELAREFEGEAFHAPNLDFLEEEEKENCEAFKFIEEDACTNNQLDFSCFSGIHGVAEITVRPSWIISPDKKLVGPGNKMLVEDYLKSRSEALGSLGEETEENRPNFGKAVHSPPAAGKPTSH
ncbi:uncharacterized protein LOC121863762, partial [Homarus americanus]|uniref:uncharacterized protein LOC121863762 n=1 Tax=Homarus americanus TaxID=6706 RepID=UPI001C45FA5E